MRREAGWKVVLEVDDLLKHEVFGPRLEGWTSSENLIQDAA